MSQPHDSISPEGYDLETLAGEIIARSGGPSAEKITAFWKEENTTERLALSWPEAKAEEAEYITCCPTCGGHSRKNGCVTRHKASSSGPTITVRSVTVCVPCLRASWFQSRFQRRGKKVFRQSADEHGIWREHMIWSPWIRFKVKGQGLLAEIAHNLILRPLEFVFRLRRA